MPPWRQVQSSHAQYGTESTSWKQQVQTRLVGRHDRVTGVNSILSEPHTNKNFFCIFSQECIFHIHDYSRKSGNRISLFCGMKRFLGAMACEYLKQAHLLFSPKKKIPFNLEKTMAVLPMVLLFFQIGFTNEVKIIFKFRFKFLLN